MEDDKCTKGLNKNQKILWKQVMDAYQNSEWQIGLDAANDLLKSKPNHDCSLAMKSAFLYNLDKCTVEEAFAPIKSARKSTNYFVHQVDGILLKAERRYSDAIEAYDRSLKDVPNNLNVLVDLAVIHIHTRNYKKAFDYTLQAFQQAPSSFAYSMRYILAAYLDRPTESTLKSLNLMLQHINDPTFTPLKASDLNILKAKIELELKHPEQAVKTAKNKKILTEIERDSILVEAYTALNNKDALLETLKRKIEFNSDDAEAFTELYKIFGSTQEFVDEYCALYPFSSNLYDMIHIEFTNSEVSAMRLMRNLLSRGVPAAYKLTKHLPIARNYVDDSFWGKVYSAQVLAESDVNAALSIIDELLSTYKVSAPVDLVAYRSYDDLASSYFNTEAIDLLIIKAEVLDLATRHSEAASVYQEAFYLDQDDRYLHTMMQFQLLKADRVDEARKEFFRFSRPEDRYILAVSDFNNLDYLVLEMEALYRLERYGEALKNAEKILYIYTDYINDQADFVSYSCTKTGMNAFVQMLDFADTLGSEKRFKRIITSLGEIVANIWLLRQTGTIDDKTNIEEIESMFQEAMSQDNSLGIPRRNDEDPSGSKKLRDNDFSELMTFVNNIYPRLVDGPYKTVFYIINEISCGRLATASKEAVTLKEEGKFNDFIPIFKKQLEKGLPTFSPKLRKIVEIRLKSL